MGRPTIRDLALQAGVSVATVNRVIGGGSGVRGPTMQRVLDAAAAIGFYGLGALQQRVQAASGNLHRVGVLIQSPHRAYTQTLAQALEAAAQHVPIDEDFGRTRVQVETLDDLSPEAAADLIQRLGAACDALAVLAAEHPLVTDAIDAQATSGVSVLALGSPLAARAPIGYVGLDSWKVGRTAAWACHHLCLPGSGGPGKLALLVGTHRYRCHDLYESGFRSYLRERGTGHTLLEPQATFESDAIARELTERLLREHPDLSGLYVSGGGIAGVLAAVRERAGRHPLVTIGHDLMPVTRAGLLDGSLQLLISHPFERLAREALLATLRVRRQGPPGGSLTVQVPFEIHTSENV